MSNGRLRTISRLALFGVDVFVEVDICFDGVFERLSRRFFKVTDNKEPLNTWAWSLLTASWANAEVVNSMCAEMTLDIQANARTFVCTCAHIFILALSLFYWPCNRFGTFILAYLLPKSFGVKRRWKTRYNNGSNCLYVVSTSRI